MRKATLFVLASAILGGCMVMDENPDWDPKADLPPWAYDAPFYYRPTEDLKPLEMVGAGIPVYYTNMSDFFLAHPGGYQPVGEPRMAIWYTTDQEEWERCGYFGVEQTHFLMEAEDDGPHWIRFIGLAQGVTQVPPGQPHRIYVVDRQPPDMVLAVDPEPYYEDEEGNRVPYIYKVGEKVTISWLVTDPNLVTDTIKLQTCFAEFPHNLVWNTLPEELPESGSADIVIPPEAVQDGGLRFRMEAQDKAENIGMAVTEILHIEGQGKPGPQPGIRPVEPSDPVLQTAGTPDKDHPGWPRKGAFIRGGMTRKLWWMPPNAKEYSDLRLEFSSNDGRAWHTIVKNLQPDQDVKWFVPEVTSKNCRLRIVGTNAKGQEMVIVMSARFTVDTVAAGMIEKVEPVEPK